MQALRYWDYYNMTETFTDLHAKASQRESFTQLYDIVTARANILLAYRTIKSNKGSRTVGTDGKTIADVQRSTEEELVSYIQRILLNYRPKQVRRVYIPKPNGKTRPLGIPSIIDRIVQQCVRQVLEPIAEAYFYKHSYGFRPLRSTHHAMARVQHLVNIMHLHYVVDMDIKGFFDHVNHTVLMKQLWNMGVRDRRVLRIVSKMLKADIEGEGVPTQGTPQGGILSPLLSNIVLHDLDEWIAGQWEAFRTEHPYRQKQYRYKVMRTTNLKEGYIVRYADDFNILCRDAKTAVKWYHAVRKYLKERLKLDISPEKSQIVNLRKRESSFLGFTIRAVRKGKKRVAQTGISLAKKRQIKQEMRERIQQIHRSPTRRNALLYNSYVLGIHQYFNRATTVNLAFSRLAYELSQCLYNRLHQVGCYGTPTRPPPTYTKFYNTSCKTYRVEDVYLFPLSQIRTVNAVNYSQTTTPFTKEGREQIYKRLRPEIQREIIRLMQSNLPERSVEYMDNRISRYSMCGGKCEVTGMFLFASEVHCHHVRPVRFEGTDRFDNLRIVHKDVHRLIHATDKKTIANLMNGLGITEKMGRTINHYRQMCNMELIDAFIGERWNAVCGESRMHGVEEGKRRR